MSLNDRIKEDMKSAMRSGEKRKLGVIRLVLAAIKQIEVDSRIEALDDAQVITVLDKMIKQRRESIGMFDKAGRDDLTKIEQAEIDVIQTFLPQALSAEEVEAIIKDAISKTGAESIKDMGKVMGIVRPQVVGRGDVGAISGQIKAILSA